MLVRAKVVLFNTREVLVRARDVLFRVREVLVRAREVLVKGRDGVSQPQGRANQGQEVLVIVDRTQTWPR